MHRRRNTAASSVLADRHQHVLHRLQFSWLLPSSCLRLQPVHAATAADEMGPALLLWNRPAPSVGAELLLDALFRLQNHEEERWQHQVQNKLLNSVHQHTVPGGIQQLLQ